MRRAQRWIAEMIVPLSHLLVRIRYRKMRRVKVDERNGMGEMLGRENDKLTSHQAQT
jgi:hypothetical protein